MISIYTCADIVKYNLIVKFENKYIYYIHVAEIYWYNLVRIINEWKQNLWLRWKPKACLIYLKYNSDYILYA